MPRRSVISQTPADPEKPRHEAKLFVEGIPATTKAEFKGACARKGQTIRDAVIEFMRDYVRRNGV